MRMQIRSGGASIPITTDSNDNDAGRMILADPETLWDVSDSTRADEDSVDMIAGGDITIDRSKTNGTLILNITGADTVTAETLTVKCYLDSGKTILTEAIVPIDLNTGALAAGGTALPDGSYQFKDIPGYAWFIEISGATRTPVITYTDA